jgi:hypothetical protein
MNKQQGQFPTDHDTIYKSLSASWRNLCDLYLPITADGSIWRYSREPTPADPEQGWKIHVAATVHTASEVLEALAPYLRRRAALFKAPVSLYELYKLNSGILYGYSQVGKFLTIYPPSAEEATRIARKLHRVTHRMSAPAVPFDFQYREDSCVYYRYGAFKVLEVENPRGDHVYAIRNPQGALVPDLRSSPTVPDWATDPFLPKAPPKTLNIPIDTPLRTTFKAFDAVAQRGRGGVYQALDLSVKPARLCILKEGRKDGEVSWDGRDGSWRVVHEAAVLNALSHAHVDVPRVYSSFKAATHHYLAMELIEGESLNQWLARKRRRLTVLLALRYSASIARLVKQIHSAGWVWRDCKPGNIMITKDRGLRPIDFEGACPIHDPDPFPWGTRSYVAPEWSDTFLGQSRLPEDIYAMGAVIYLLFSGSPPDDSKPVPLRQLRSNVPLEICELVSELLDHDPRRRPLALAVYRRLSASLSRLRQRNGTHQPV